MSSISDTEFTSGQFAAGWKMAEIFLGRSKRLGGRVSDQLGGLRMENVLAAVKIYDGDKDVQALSDWLANETVFAAHPHPFVTALNICRGAADHCVGLAAALAANMCVPSALLGNLSPDQTTSSVGLGQEARIVSVSQDAEAKFSFDATSLKLCWESTAPIVNLTQASHCLLPIWQGSTHRWAMVSLDSARVSVAPLQQRALLELGLGHIRVDDYDVSQAIFTAETDVFNSALISQQLIGAVLALYLAHSSLDECILFVRHRDFGAGKLSQQQAIQHKIANLQAELMISGDWLECALRDHGTSASLPTEKAAAVCSVVLRSAREVVEGGRQLLGGRGFLLDFPVSSAGLQLTALNLLIGQLEALESCVSATLWGAVSHA
jgi:hypothetical protein